MVFDVTILYSTVCAGCRAVIQFHFFMWSKIFSFPALVSQIFKANWYRPKFALLSERVLSGKYFHDENYLFFSVNVGLASIWRMMGRPAWISTNARLPFLAASAASTPMAHSSACASMATKPWSEIPIHAKLCRVRHAIIPSKRSEVQQRSTVSSSPLMSRVPDFSRGAVSDYGRPPWDTEAERRRLKLHHLETGDRYQFPTIPSFSEHLTNDKSHRMTHYVGPGVSAHAIQ